MSLKNPVTPPGIDPGTVRLVGRRLNHHATPGPIENVAVPNFHLSEGHNWASLSRVLFNDNVNCYDRTPRYFSVTVRREIVKYIAILKYRKKI